MTDEEVKTQYIQNLIDNADSVQLEIEHLLERHRVLPAGKGFMDLILLRSEATQLISDLAKAQVAVRSLSWWCLCTPRSEELLGCPHGYGGPKNLYGEGWFSECVHYPEFESEKYKGTLSSFHIKPSNLAEQYERITCQYITEILPSEPFFKDCLHPGLWLFVPDGWERRFYFPAKSGSQ